MVATNIISTKDNEIMNRALWDINKLRRKYGFEEVIFKPNGMIDIKLKNVECTLSEPEAKNG